MAYLVTGSAGFIGFHLSKRLLDEGHEIIGLDNCNDYYDVSLKEARNHRLEAYKNYTFHRTDLADYEAMEELFRRYRFTHVIHLAAQAGVRYSIERPFAYVRSNLDGFMNLLELCRHYPVSHLIYASSSSVYGANTKVPFSESDPVDHPVSLYAATKKSNELLAHSYSHLYAIPATGLRFFTVYGPWGRPDMAYFSFTRAINDNCPIDVFNNGDMERDFTYIDDVINGIVPLISTIPDRSETDTPAVVYNIGNNKPVKLSHFIEVIEKSLGKSAQKNYLPMQPGDVYMTYADIERLSRAVGYNPTTTIETGIPRFIEWFREYYS